MRMCVKKNKNNQEDTFSNKVQGELTPLLMSHSLPPQVKILAVFETNHFKAFLSLHLLLPLSFEYMR